MRLYLQGEAVQGLMALLPQLDGQPISAAAAAAGLAAADASDLVEILAARGALDDGEDQSESELDAALSAFTHRPRAAARRMAAAGVAVDGDGQAAGMIRNLLASVGVREGTDAEFAIVARDAPLPRPVPRPQSIAVVMDGPVAWVGPTWLPGHACPACLASRLQGQMVRPETMEGVAAGAVRLPQPAALPTLVHQAAALAVQEAILHLSGARPPVLLDAAAEITVGSLRIHPVLPVPGCVCGGPA